MPEVETPAVTTEVQTEQSVQTDASPELSDASEKSAAEMIGEDLAKTIAQPPAEKPDVAEQETSETEETTEEQETTATAESDSQSEESKGSDEPPKKKSAKPENRYTQLVGKLKEKTAETEKWKAAALARVEAPAPLPPRSQEKTPEYWAALYAQNKTAGLDDSDPRQQQAALNYEQFKEEVRDEKKEVQRMQREAQVKTKRSVVNSLFEIHSDIPFLKPATNNLGFEIDMQSPLAQKMIELASVDGISLENDSAAIVIYAQKAERNLLRQQLSGEHREVDTLKRKTAEAIAKGTMTNGARTAPQKPPSREKQLAALERQAAGGNFQARKQLGMAAVAADLGM